MARLDRITRIPALEPVCAPTPAGPSAAAIDAVSAGLIAEPGGFDSHLWLVAEASPRRIAVFPARYSWSLVISGGARDLGLGLLGVALWLEQEGQIIWQRRAASVAQGGTWDLAATGAVDVGESLEAAAYREAREELGLAEADIGHLRPRLLLSGYGEGALAVFSSNLAPGVRLRPDPQEVAEIARTRDAAPDGPLCTCSAEIVAALLAERRLSAG